MIYEFKSRVTGTLVTTQDVAERILLIMGKSITAKGVILPEQMAAAIAALEHAIANERAAVQDAGKPAASSRPAADEQEDSNEDGHPGRISLAQRAFPFLDMLRTAQAAGKEITWGV